MKICSKCKIEKPLTEFYKRSDSVDGFRNKCKSCFHVWREQNREALKKYDRLSYKKNKSTVLAKKRQWYAENREKTLNYRKSYYQKNKAEISEKQKIYRKENIEAYKERDKKYNEANKEKIKLRHKKYRENNRDKLKAKRRVWESEKKKNDPIFKLTLQLRDRVTKAIKKSYTKKASSTRDLLGSSVAYVRKHLEAQFVDGMSWDNHGEWHIDHIRPCASFDLSDPEQQRECFNYKNLQPLWAEDNLRKSDRF